MSRIEEFELSIAPLDEDPRKIWVYLPDSYDHTQKRYDVLYMFDGHNLFFDEVATYGKSWGMKDYLDANHIDLVVVGEDCNHKGNRRMDEYCPMLDDASAEWNNEKITPQGIETAEWFVNVLKKECEKRYRVYKTRKHIGIAGSSMGGLMACYMIAAHNDVFSKAACVSPAIYYCRKEMERLIASTEFAATRIYMDFGSEERKAKKDVVALVDTMLGFSHLFGEKGCNTYPNLVVNGTHSEASWETIVPVFLRYLYPELFQGE